MIEIRWHGRGGQGAFTASKMLGNAALRKGRFALSFPSFGPERRGAPIQAYTKISNEKISDRSALTKADYIVYLDETLFSINSLTDLKENGLVFLNTKTPEKYAGYKQIVAYDANSISEEILKRPMGNTAMLALLAKETGIVTRDNIEKALEDYLSRKVADRNKELVERIYAYDETKAARI